MKFALPSDPKLRVGLLIFVGLIALGVFFNAAPELKALFLLVGVLGGYLVWQSKRP